jgi:hypothetical protein
VWPAGLAQQALLGLAIAVAAARAYRPVLTGRLPSRPALTGIEVRQGLCYLVIGAAQAACVALLWRAGPAGPTPPAMLPLLVAVPMLEALIGWHAAQLDPTPPRRAPAQPVKARPPGGVTVATVAGLIPPLAVGIAFAVAAYRLPYGLSAQDGVRDLLLSLAGGTLLGGVFAVTLLVAVRGHTATAATLAVATPLLTAVAPALPAAASRLPTVVAILSATYLIGLLAVAHTALDHRRTS